jgi:N-acetylglutamate synthase-like GNAT family acetyltransferase
MSHIVRKADKHEFEKVDSLIKHSARSIQVLFYSESSVDAALELVSNIVELIEAGNLFVVECEFQIIACGGFSVCEIEPLQAEIKSFFVHPDFVRKGIATKLLEACENKCLHIGIKTISLMATLASEPFYRSRGFSELKRVQQSLSNGEFFELIKMQKNISVW